MTHESVEHGSDCKERTGQVSGVSGVDGATGSPLLAEEGWTSAPRSGTHELDRTHQIQPLRCGTEHTCTYSTHCQSRSPALGPRGSVAAKYTPRFFQRC
jgi:hypothetical protein